MLKKIALATIFALVSVVSFSPTAANARSAKAPVLSPTGAPVMQGLCGCMKC